MNYPWRPILAAAVVLLLLTSAVGAGVAAPASSAPADDAFDDPADDVPDTPSAGNETPTDDAADEVPVDGGSTDAFESLLERLEFSTEVGAILDGLFPDVDVNSGTDEDAPAETDEDADEDETEETDGDEVDRTAVERHVHEAVNEERAEHGVDELEFDTELRDVARAHSEDMAERDYLAHEDPDGDGVGDRYEAAGYECEANGYVGGENIAQTWYDTPVDTDDRGTVHYETEEELGEGVVEQWMNSPGHQENLLAEHWEVQGIGVYVTDDDQVYVTQNFC